MTSQIADQNGSEDQHIVFRDGAWALVPDGSDDPIRLFDTRDEALRWAARAMNHQGTNLIVHNEDGSVNDTIRPES